MADLFQSDDFATPLAEEEKEGLIPSWVTFRHELNALEQENILQAQQWAFQGQKNVLDNAFLRRLHKRMFGGVWRWAGVYRQTARNIGVDAWRITTELKTLLDDVTFWIENHTYPLDEIGARFHHRLVWIHPFPNGNGRFARLATDLLMRRLSQPLFTWGSNELTTPSETRHHYIQALRKADGGDIQELMAFVRA